MQKGRKVSSMDKGWAWVILIACFFNCFICGIVYTTGIFNIVFLEWFSESRAKTSLCAALPMSLFCFGAPFVSMLNRIIGLRTTVLLGGLLIFSGFTITTFVQSFEAVFFAYGIMAGFGFSLVYAPSLVAIGFYFKKYRNIAYGIVNMGIGSGTMVFAIVIESLIKYYGTRSTMLILGAVCSHCFVFGALMIPYSALKQSLTNNDTSIVIDGTNTMQCEIQSESCEFASGNLQDTNFINAENNNIDHVDGTVNENKYSDRNNLSNDVNKFVLDGEDNTSKHITLENKGNTEKHLNSTHLKSLGPKNPKKQDCNTFFQACSLNYQNFKFVVSWSFLLLNINVLLGHIGLSCIYIHFPAYVLSFNSELQTSPFYSAMGIGNISCRLIAGLITNGSKTRTFYTYIITMLLTGITSVVGPYICKYYTGQIVFAFTFAFFGNTFIGLLCPVIIDLFELDNLNLGFGLSCGTSGLGLAIGPPLAAWIYDITETYFYTFILSGVCYITAAVFMLLIPLIKQIEKTKRVYRVYDR